MDYEQIIQIAEDLKTKKAVSDDTQNLLKEIQDAVNKGAVEIQVILSRSSHVLFVPPELLTNYLTNKKTDIDSQIGTTISNFSVKSVQL